MANRCGFESQFSTVSGSVYSVLQGTSREILLIGFGGSAVPDKLYSRPDPPGRAKNNVACTQCELVNFVTEIKYIRIIA